MRLNRRIAKLEQTHGLDRAPEAVAAQVCAVLRGEVRVSEDAERVLRGLREAPSFLDRDDFELMLKLHCIGACGGFLVAAQRPDPDPWPPMDFEIPDWARFEPWED